MRSCAIHSETIDRYEDETSEDVLDLPSQPPDTCPLIDQLIAALGRTDIRTDQCEAIRQRAMDLRAWGQGWKDVALAQIAANDTSIQSRLDCARRDRQVRRIVEGFAENLR